MTHPVSMNRVSHSKDHSGCVNVGSIECLHGKNSLLLPQTRLTFSSSMFDHTALEVMYIMVAMVIRRAIKGSPSPSDLAEKFVLFS